MLSKKQKKCLVKVFDLRYKGKNLDKEIYLSLKKMTEKESDEKPTGSFKIAERIGKPVVEHISAFMDVFYSMLFIDANHKNVHVMFIEELRKKLYISGTVHTNNIITYIRNQDSLYIPSYFIDEFSLVIKDYSSDFVIFPILYQTSFSNVSHYNICIYNKINKSLERFEPHGSLKKGEFYVDDALKNFFNDIFPNSVNKYYTPIEICPFYGFQRIQVKEMDIIDTDPVGFCIAWSVWYVDLRLLNPKKSQKQVIDFALKTFKEKKTSLTKFIRTYNDALRNFTHEYIQKNVTFETIKKYGQVEIYTLEGCSSCKQAKELFIKHGIKFTEFAVLDENADEKTRKKYPKYVYFSNKKIQPRNNPTFPIIYIQQNVLIGGFSDLKKLKEK
jgi:glutaredoxin